ncbi:RidA family protein [Micromonospora sp. NPDC047620]|uniref:RidA family protein n=1 Tax=Micromonospora sp. NPDC047620 TaxID=3364251 RepID=UPI003719D3E7
MLEAVRADVGGLERIASAVRLTVYVAGAPDFTDQHLVADAAAQCLLHVLGPEVGRQSRAAIGVAALPAGCRWRWGPPSS